MTGQLSLFDPTPQNEKAVDVDMVQPIAPIDLDKDHPGIKLLDLIPDDALLALTRNYPTRSVHVSRILGLLSENQKKGTIFTREEVGDNLTMTWANTQGVINVMRRMQLIDDRTRITPFGNLVLSFNPFIDDIGLLWLLHYLLASDARLVLWANLFDSIVYDREEINITEIAEQFKSLEGKWSNYSVNKKAPREVKTILQTYTEELFYPLRLLREQKSTRFLAFWDTGIIPPLIWLSILHVYRDRYYPGVASLEVPLIVRGHFSPGRILRQNEAVVRRSLDELHNNRMLTVETRSGLDQVRFKRETTWIVATLQYLQGKK